jgi:hypothetical protein
MNEECRMKSRGREALRTSFLIHHSSFIISGFRGALPGDDGDDDEQLDDGERTTCGAVTGAWVAFPADLQRRRAEDVTARGI